jgi:hypothetical protein
MNRRSQFATIAVGETAARGASASPIPERQETTEGSALDDAALRSLRDLFLLLDEWDRAAQEGTQDFPKEADISVDLKST